MKMLYYGPAFLLCLAGATLAQPAAEGAGPANRPDSPRELRRNELRNVLQAPPPVGSDVKRQLSARERVELRQQLRQSKLATSRSTP
jgi:hypothetical protein